MKSLLITTICALVLTSTFAAPAPTNRPKLTPEERAARMAERARRIYEHEGGYVERKRAGKLFRIVNTTTKIANADIEEGAASFRANLDFPVEVVTRAVEKDPAVYLGADAGFVVVILDDVDSPAILTAPENAWATVNIGKLNPDGADAKLLTKRTLREVWRAAGLGLGGGYVGMANDLMAPISSVQELDAVKADTPSPACYNMMIGVGQRLGIMPVRTATYRQACQEGWAMMPTNDVQKRIWKEVHELPSKPLTIEKK